MFQNLGGGGGYPPDLNAAFKQVRVDRHFTCGPFFISISGNKKNGLSVSVFDLDDQGAPKSETKKSLNFKNPTQAIVFGMAVTRLAISFNGHEALNGLLPVQGMHPSVKKQIEESFGAITEGLQKMQGPEPGDGWKEGRDGRGQDDDDDDNDGGDGMSTL